MALCFMTPAGTFCRGPFSPARLLLSGYSRSANHCHFHFEETALCLAEGPNTVCTDQGLAYLRWIKVIGDIRGEAPEYPKDFNEGCRLFDTYAAYMLKDLSKIGFSTSGVRNVDYVVSIRLITEKGPDICLEFQGKEVIREVTTPREFVLAIGSRGIHALKVVSEDGSLSE
ncbi:MAG: hypothetical protein M1813_003570 [Trichoglossum hirsutum]|nr:MAG: hypothetical protein M1813_003570 [Trichoglossum hirsutum]